MRYLQELGPAELTVTGAVSSPKRVHKMGRRRRLSAHRLVCIGSLARDSKTASRKSWRTPAPLVLLVSLILGFASAVQCPMQTPTNPQLHPPRMPFLEEFLAHS